MKNSVKKKKLTTAIFSFLKVFFCRCCTVQKANRLRGFFKRRCARTTPQICIRKWGRADECWKRFDWLMGVSLRNFLWPILCPSESHLVSGVGWVANTLTSVVNSSFQEGLSLFGRASTMAVLMFRSWSTFLFRQCSQKYSWAGWYKSLQ